MKYMVSYMYYGISEQAKQIYSDRKQISGFLGFGGLGGLFIAKGHKKTYCSNRNVLYLHGQDASKCTLKTSAFYCISMKLIRKIRNTC